MTRKSSKANSGGKAPKEKRVKEPEVEKFRSLEELNREFTQRRGAGMRSLGDLTSDFQKQPAIEVAKTPEPLPKEKEQISGKHGTGVLKKIFEGRGFGFITPDYDNGAGDVFLHFSDIFGGGARSLGIGTWVRYDIEPDAASGRLRAKNVSVLPSTPSTAPSESPSQPKPEVMEALPPTVSSCVRSYNRDIMLGTFKAMAARKRLGKGLKLFTVPMPPVDESGRADEQDPYLDDERLIARLEARLDKESGADAMNMQTFGACSGWSFEEALEANQKLRIVGELPQSEDSTTAAASTASGSFSEPAEKEVSKEDSDSREEDSDATSSEDRRRREARRRAKVEAAEARAIDDKWSWEAAAVKAKLVEDHRQTWEQKQASLTASPLFQ